jgi:beta-glucanase (GH16 family)
MTYSLFRTIAAAAFVSCASVAPVVAAPLTWQVSNVVFDDGGTLAGTFIFDAATQQYSSIDLFSTAGTTITSNRHYGVGPAKFVLPKQATESDPGAAWCYGGS